MCSVSSKTGTLHSLLKSSNEKMSQRYKTLNLRGQGNSFGTGGILGLKKNPCILLGLVGRWDCSGMKSVAEKGAFNNTWWQYVGTYELPASSPAYSFLCMGCHFDLSYVECSHVRFGYILGVWSVLCPGKYHLLHLYRLGL